MKVRRKGREIQESDRPIYWQWGKTIPTWLINTFPFHLRHLLNAVFKHFFFLLQFRSIFPEVGLLERGDVRVVRAAEEGYDDVQGQIRSHHVEAKLKLTSFQTHGLT